MLDRDAILARTDLPREEVEIEEWGGSVFVRTMTGAERDRFETQFLKAGKTENFAGLRPLLAALTVCDESGRRLFSEADVEAISALSAAALARIWDVAMRLSGLSAAAVDAAEKNSAPIPSGDSAFA